jgi:N-acyl amino acid synthase FeeM
MSLSLTRHFVPQSYQAPVNVAPRQDQYFARLALDAQTRRDAYRLRYDSYVTAGFIEPNETRLFQDVYDDLPNCQTIVLYDQDEPVASVRTCLLAYGSRQRSPAMDTYPAQVTQLLRQHMAIGIGGRGIETTRLVRSPAAENNQGLVFLLYRLAGYVGMMAHTQILFACVRQNHMPFYRRLGYRPVTEPHPYPGLSCPMLLMACTRQRYDEIREAFPLIDPYGSATETLDGFLAGETIPISLVRS